ncbi:helix-turn-helix domain-containing protein, partial [Kutzneria sp. 744]|uniref:TetR/AcrR family transcriptional regulator n=1 Tax=Kutzneria sp. (strain 744) TaxID=345341 RepID=UPI0012F8AF91
MSVSDTTEPRVSPMPETVFRCARERDSPGSLDSAKCEWFITPMPRTRPRTLSTSEERRETVLRTAVETFASRGYYGTTTTEVATRAGISQ